MLQKSIQNLINSLWAIRIFLDLVPKESPCINPYPANVENMVSSE
jgi:hypothetical protein